MRTRLLLLLAFLSSWSLLPAQEALLRQADRLYANYSYHDAIERYEQAFRKEATSMDGARRLADCYWTLRDAPNAERWYAIVAAS